MTGTFLSGVLSAWAAANLETLRAADPIAPDALGDREAEIWGPLLAIADMAGGEWPARARAAAVDLHRGAAPVESNGLRLLRNTAWRHATPNRAGR